MNTEHVAYTYIGNTDMIEASEAGKVSGRCGRRGRLETNLLEHKARENRYRAYTGNSR